MDASNPEYRKSRLKVYEEAIANGVVLKGYPNLAKQICHYDQLVMIDRNTTVYEELLAKIQNE